MPFTIVPLALNRRKKAVFLAAIIVETMLAATRPHQSVARIELSRFVTNETGAALEVSPVFLSEESMALLVRPRPPLIAEADIFVIQWATGTVQSHARMTDTDYPRDPYPVSGKRLIVAGRYLNSLYSADLNSREVLPLRVLVQGVPWSSTIGEYKGDSWRVYALTPKIPTVIREGRGELQAVSDDFIVYRRDDAIHTEKLAGGAVGAFSVKPETAHSQFVEIAGRNQLYVDTFPEGRMVAFNGKESLRLHPPPGWGIRHGWSANGSRMLFDHFTRTIPVLERSMEILVAIVTLGLGAANESANGETVRVVDTTNGAVCFNLESPAQLLGNTGGWHADISPSGRLVAVATPTELSIYRLPEVCKEK